MSIRILSPEVASQIAAGEVVERPASVVKELVENALDAGAHNVTINVDGAGRRRIEIADDGSGIPADEMQLAVARHATSKLQTADELFKIATLGFRGEALASIGSVSRMTVTSRTTDGKLGARLHVEGGQIGKVEQIGSPAGTVVRVEDLFYNVPARLKFLKQDLTERRLIDNLLTRYALAYPSVRFKLNQDGKTVLHTSGDGDRRTILAALYGVETARLMLEVQDGEEGLKLSGFISPTTLTRSNRKDITFFVNGRWIQDVPLTTALLQAYHTLLMVGRYPLSLLFLELEPAEVDVNVHPAKAEVRFRQPDRIFSFVQRTVRRNLLAYTPIPNLQPQTLWGTPRTQPGQMDPAWSLAHEGNEQLVKGDERLKEGSSTLHPLTATPQQVPFTNHIPLLRLIGQIGSTYLVAEGPDGLYLIDQHAAHERVLFEKLMAQHEHKNIPAQALLTPVAVTFPPQSTTVLTSQLPTLQHIGFDVEIFGPNTFQVRSIPSIFINGDPAAALRAVVDNFEEDETPLQAEVEIRLAARVCKRLSVKAGQTLSSEEQRTLLTDLENCDSPRTCPHGRPTMIHLSVDMLERQFGRMGAR